MFCNILIIKSLRYVHRTSIFVHLLTEGSPKKIRLAKSLSQGGFNAVFFI
jgi:hypothetical protein